MASNETSIIKSFQKANKNCLFSSHSSLVRTPFRLKKMSPSTRGISWRLTKEKDEAVRVQQSRGAGEKRTLSKIKNSHQYIHRLNKLMKMRLISVNPNPMMKKKNWGSQPEQRLIWIFTSWHSCYCSGSATRGNLGIESGTTAGVSVSYIHSDADARAIQ